MDVVLYCVLSVHLLIYIYIIYKKIHCKNFLYAKSKVSLIFLLRQKSLDIKIMFHEDIPSVNISKLNY